MNLITAHERRRSRRVPISKPVELQTEHGRSPISTTATNLSHTGMCVEGVSGVHVGDSVRCRLLFTPSEPLGFTARVVWNENESSAGLHFEDVTDHRGAQLSRYLTRLQWAASTSSPSLHIDPFCESGTWSRELIVDPDLFEEDADTEVTEARFQRFYWGVMLGALAGGAAAALLTAWLLN